MWNLLPSFNPKRNRFHRKNIGSQCLCQFAWRSADVEPHWHGNLSQHCFLFGQILWVYRPWTGHHALTFRGWLNHGKWPAPSPLGNDTLQVEDSLRIQDCGKWQTHFFPMNLHDTYAHACSPFAWFSTRACVRNLPFQVAHSERDAADNKPPVVYPNPRRRCRALPCVASEKVEPREVQKYWFVKCSNRTCVIHAMKWLSEFTRMPCTVATDDFRQATGNHSRPGSTSPRNQPTIDAFAALFQPTFFSAGGQPIPRIL